MRDMARKQIKVSERILFTWFLLAGFILLFAPQNLTNKFGFAFARIFHWPLRIGRNISLSTQTKQPVSDVVSRREYDQLVNHLNNIIEQRNQEHRKVEKLSGLRDTAVWERMNFVLADVITSSIDGSHCELIINRGQDDGLAKGQFVLDDNSVVGVVSDVLSRTARVRLVTDPASNIAVKISGLDVGRLMQGRGNGSARIPLLAIKHKVRAGDIVYADKKPGFLDVPVITGKIEQCKRDDENPSLWDITVRPVCDIEKMSDVAVIVMNRRQ